MRRLLAGGTSDIAILDLMLPGEDGLSLCRWAQQQHRRPVIMLSAQGVPASRVVGLDMGAVARARCASRPRCSTAWRASPRRSSMRVA